MAPRIGNGYICRIGEMYSNRFLNVDLLVKSRVMLAKLSWLSLISNDSRPPVAIMSLVDDPRCWERNVSNSSSNPESCILNVIGLNVGVTS